MNQTKSQKGELKTMTILSELIGSDDLTELAAGLNIPVVAGLQHQGDVTVVPARWARDYQQPTTPVPPAGVPVVRGEAGGNTHLLLASGSDVMFAPNQVSPSDLALGWLLVPAGAVAWLDHREHGNSGIAPGAYELRRKREQADELRIVAD